MFRGRPLALFLLALMMPLTAMAQPGPEGPPVPDVPAVAEQPAIAVTAAPVPPSEPLPPAVLPVAVVPASEPVIMPPLIVPPPTGDQLLSGATGVLDAYRTGGWLAALAAVVSLLTALLRYFGVLDKIDKRWRILVPLALGCAAAALAALAAGMPWLEALTLALLSGPAAVALHQGLARSLLGIESPETKALKSGAGI